MQEKDVRTVGVVGCGLMGSGIVEVAARAGQRVVYLESSDELVDAGRRRIETSTLRAVERGKLDEGEREEILGRISGTTDVRDLADVDLVIEAATEDPEIKRAVFRQLDEITRPEVVLASNTSSIPIADLGAATKRPDRVIGMHFFNPVPLMDLIEIVKSITTSDDTVEFARDYAAVLGKTAVLSGDRAGFIVNTLLIPYLNDAMRMLQDGFATREDLDTAIQLGLNHPMGPLRLADLIGLDTCLHIAEVLYEEYRDARFAPPPLLRRMVTAGRLGRKSGRRLLRVRVAFLPLVELDAPIRWFDHEEVVEWLGILVEGEIERTRLERHSGPRIEDVPERASGVSVPGHEPVAGALEEQEYELFKVNQLALRRPGEALQLRQVAIDLFD